ncbi:transcriptional regulator (plasmid) [Burkholderia vietnamiensis]|nr:transcriptional regulator [Burkholderia vietnamiensis]
MKNAEPTMPNNNVLTAGERNAIERAISEVELCCQFSLANELRALLAAHPGQPEPRDAIARSKRILMLVDEYHDNPTSDTRTALRVALMDEFQPEPRAEVAEEQPSLTNPLTPYGMLVRALRVAAKTTLNDMAKHMQCGPAALSAVEFGRKPLTDAMVADTAAYFSSVGIHDTLHALNAARAGDAS